MESKTKYALDQTTRLKVKARESSWFDPMQIGNVSKHASVEHTKIHNLFHREIVFRNQVTLNSLSKAIFNERQTIKISIGSSGTHRKALEFYFHLQMLGKNWQE